MFGNLGNEQLLRHGVFPQHGFTTLRSVGFSDHPMLMAFLLRFS